MSKRITITEEQYKFLVNEINLYHGSRANFDHFDLAYALSGSGEMGYGRGVYLSDYRDAALEYSSNGGYLYTVKVPKGKYLKNSRIRWEEAYDVACKFREYFMTTEQGKTYSGYEKEWWDTEGRFIADADTGFDLYAYISSELSHDEEEAGKWLRSIGYVGLRQNCVNRETGFKFHNYVIFDENDVQIVSKERC